MLDAKQAKRQEAERKRLQAFVDRFKAKASKARQAQSRMKMLERMKPIAALVTQDVREISFPAPEKMLSPPIIARRQRRGRLRAGKPVLNRVTLRIDNDDRIALLGANGNGKSTLVKLLAGRLDAVLGRDHARGKARRSPISPSISSTNSNEDASAYDHVRKLMPDAPESEGARPRRRDRLFRQGRRHAGRQACPAARRRGCCSGLRPSSAPT